MNPPVTEKVFGIKSDNDLKVAVAVSDENYEYDNVLTIRDTRGSAAEIQVYRSSVPELIAALRAAVETY